MSFGMNRGQPAAQSPSASMMFKPPAGAVVIPGTAAPSTITRTVERSAETNTSGTNESAQTYQTVVKNVLTDDGEGGFGYFGSVDYTGKTVTVKLVDKSSQTDNFKSEHANAEAFEKETIGGEVPDSSSTSNTTKGGEYGTTSVGEEVLAASTVRVRYATGFAASTSHSESLAPDAVVIDLCPYTTDYVVPNSVRFVWMGHVYEDFDGVIYRDRTATDAGFIAGQLDYAEGIAKLFDYVVDGPATDFVLESLLTQKLSWNTAQVFGRTQSAPIAPSGFAMQVTAEDGTQFVATAGVDGLITSSNVRGRINYQTGTFELNFGEYVEDASLSAEKKGEWWYDADEIGGVEPGKVWVPKVVDPRQLRYNAVTYFYLPLDASILGVDPVRLPQDGRVPIFRNGGFAVVGHTGITNPATVVNTQIVNLGRTRLSRVRVIGSTGVTIQTGYTHDLEAGTVTFNDVSGYPQPVRIEHRIEDMVVIADVQIDGTLQFSRQLTHDFPANNTFVSSALVASDVRARTSLVFDQVSWTNVWQDNPIGAGATGEYNDILFPITCQNDGAMSERWALRFTSSTSFEIIGEHLGLIGTGNINSDTRPLNPISGAPYLFIPEGGWGSGWATGNVLRINTVGAMIPVWLARTIQPGQEGAGDYKFEVLARGGVDAPPPTP